MVGIDEAQRPLRVTLREVLRRVDRDLFLPLSGPDPDTVPVCEVAICDPTDDQHPADAVLLAPGLDPATDHALLRQLATDHVAAVVVRGPDVHTDAEALPLSVLSIDLSLTWDRAYTLLCAALDDALGEATTAPASFRTQRLGDLFALADAISASVGGSVLVLDSQNRVLAFSGGDQPMDEWRQGTILGRRVPEDWERRFHREGVYRVLRTPGAIASFALADNPAFRPRRAIGVHAGGRLIGVIGVAEGDIPFDEGTDGVLREAARMAALPLLRHFTRQAHSAHRQDERVRAVLAGDGASAAVLVRLGLESDQPLLVVAVAPRHGREAVLDDLGPQLRMRLPAEAAMVSVIDGSRLYGIVTAPALVLARLASQPAWFAESSAAKRGLVAGLSRAVIRADEIAVAREEADRIVDAVAKGLVPQPVASPVQAWPHLALAEAQHFTLTDDAMRYGRASQLAVHDRTHGTQYVETLSSFLRLRGDSAAAAAELHIHPNTLRYRIGRACEIAGIDLDDPTERLVLELQLSALTAR